MYGRQHSVAFDSEAPRFQAHATSRFQSCLTFYSLLPFWAQDCSMPHLGSSELQAVSHQPGRQPSASPRRYQARDSKSSAVSVVRTEVCEVEASITESCSDLKRRVAEHLCVCRGKIQLVSGKFVVRNGLKVWRILRSFGGVLSVVLRRPPEACTFDGEKVDPFRGGSAFAGCLRT